MQKTTRKLLPISALILAVLVFVILPGSLAEVIAQEDDDREADLKRIRQTADEILELISKTSGLPIKGEIKIDIVNKQQVREFMITTLEKEYPGDKLQRQYQAMSYLGLVPSGIDIKNIMVELIAEQAGAFYNPENDTFYAISDLPPMYDNPLFEKVIIAHELTHALQDMSIDLYARTRELADRPDELYGVMAVMEGMATVVMTVGAMPQTDIRKLPDLGSQTRMQMAMVGSMPEMKAFNAAPVYLQESLISPYAEGATFVQKYMAEHPDKEVGSIIDNLPVSSEQVLHYEKYKNGDKPSLVNLADAIKQYEENGWELIYSGGLGEFDLRVMMQVFEKGEEAKPIAEGWDAFTFAALQKGEDIVVFGGSAWDSAEDGLEFAESFSSVLKKKWGEESSVVVTDNAVVTFVAGNNKLNISHDLAKTLISEVQLVE
jgi:hypothetical protein